MKSHSSRNLLAIGLGTALPFGVPAFAASEASSGDNTPDPEPRPNFILLMSDDQGWGDVGFNGNDRLRTPHLDEMAAGGMAMERFYAASPICSPTRGSVLTGRHFSRYGIHAAHTGGMRVGEVTIAELLKEEGYATGIFGKWHNGWVFPDEQLSRGVYSPPWHHGFEESFVTTSAVPTWNPTVTPPGWNNWGQREGEPWKGGEPYVHNGEPVSDNMDGDDSRVIMDRVIPFIRENAEEQKPFLAVVWFHTPHEPVVAGPEYLEMYSDLPDDQAHYFGSITAMDEQIGRLREELRELGLSENTLISFTSDNGAHRQLVRRGYASSGPFRGSKHTAYEGGVRMPTVFEWPGRIAQGRSDFMSSTYDYLPTVLDYLGLEMPDNRPLDGVSLAGTLNGETGERPGFVVIGYQRLHRDHIRHALIENRYKLIFSDPDSPFKDVEGTSLEALVPDPPAHLKRHFGEEGVFGGRGATFELYDLLEDPGESKDLATEKPEEARRMIDLLDDFFHSVNRSDKGADYNY